MAGSVSIPNAFAALTGPIPLVQLDGNFTSLLNGVNSTLTYGNYYVDSSGSPNSIVLTINSPTTFSYQAGVPLQVKIANTNTGATQINVNGLGAKNVTTTSLSTLTAGQLVASAVVTMIYDGTQFQVQNPSIAAVGAAGSNSQFQYNSGGAFAGASMTYNNVTGGISIPAPSAGETLTIAALTGGAGISVGAAELPRVAVTGNGVLTTSIRSLVGSFVGLVGTETNHGLNLRTNNFDRMTISATGNFVILAPSSGVALTLYETLNTINAQKTVATYDTGSFTGTLTGCTTSPTATFNWSRAGNVVVIDCSAGISATSNTNAMTITGLPAALTPVRTQLEVARLLDNGGFVVGTAQVTGTTFVFGNGIGGSTFTTSGTKGITAGFKVTYNLT